jgi:mono/diheme cytochrome c family protein
MGTGVYVAPWIVITALFVGIQLVPYGRDHRNPPATGAVAWDSPRTKELAMRACANCHSYETQWPWYASLAPISWRVQNHVDEGREHLNFSTYDQPQRHAHEAAEMVEEGEMPPWDYLLMHPEAKLSPEEKKELVKGLAATFVRQERPDGGPGRGAGRDSD